MKQREVRWELMFPDELERRLRSFRWCTCPMGCASRMGRRMLWGVTRCGPRAICAKRRSNTAAL